MRKVDAMTARTRLGTCLVLLLCATNAFALILGGEGNTPLNDPGWPKGAAVIFNTKSRIAYWEGPPFGGGQWHAECRGDAKALSAVLADFAKLDVKSKQVVLHDGVGQSFWLGTSRRGAKKADTQMDWMFMVWQPGSWDRQRNLPADISAVGPADAKNGPPSQIDVYTAGNVKWADVVIPKGLKIVDNRLVEGHGFKSSDGIVFEGHVTDLVTKKPLAARVRVDRLSPQQGESAKAAETVTDKQGHWVLKNVPAGSHRVVVEADGHVPRVVGYANLSDQPKWQQYDCGLARAGVVTGIVKDEAGKPLPNVSVRIGNVAPEGGGRYESPGGYTFATGPDGRFRAELIPAGKVTVYLHIPGYIGTALGDHITAPKENLELTMRKSAHVLVTVAFTGKVRPNGYMVSITPEGGDKVGTYGGSGNINDKNQLTFQNVPPGRYIIRGRPNPGSDDQQTDPVTIDPKGGQTIEVKLQAK
jgi:Carboxypeptidase regulatory-like domain